MKCDRIVILAAGRASRMRSSAMDIREGSALVNLSLEQDALSRPKPMIRVGPNQEPLLQFIMEQALRAGFTEATLVLRPDDAVTKPFINEWNVTPSGQKMQVGWAEQHRPLGTAHAVQCALEQDPVPSGSSFVLCNGDNVPTRQSLARLRSEPRGQAVLAYDRDTLGLPLEKIRAFAILKGIAGRLQSIFEKPDQAFVDRIMLEDDSVLVSMNLFRLDPDVLRTFLLDLSPHPTRGELELPEAIQRMVQAGHSIEMVKAEDEVLDLTCLTDVDELQDGLKILEPFQLEVCASTPSDVRVSVEAGAHRLELCSHWPCGGLTPPETDIRRSVHLGIPVHALIRPRAGHFHFSNDEKAWMTDQIEASFEAGAARAVVGGLNTKSRLDLVQLEAWASRFGGHRLVVHRALDASADWRADISALKTIGIHRLLSSGGGEKATDGAENIRFALKNGFYVTAASGVRPNQREDWIQMGISDFHASCRRETVESTRHFDGRDYPVHAEEVGAWFR